MFAVSVLVLLADHLPSCKMQPDRGAAVPRFGDWDENNPQSADNYTHIFNKVREERHTGPSNLQAGNNFEPSYHMKRKQNASGDRKVCCAIDSRTIDPVIFST